MDSGKLEFNCEGKGEPNKNTEASASGFFRVLTKYPFQNVFVNTHKSLFFSSVKKEIIKRNQVFEDAFLILIGSQIGYYDEDG